MSDLYVYFNVAFLRFLLYLCHQDEDKIHDSRLMCCNNGAKGKVRRIGDYLTIYNSFYNSLS